MRRIVLLLLGGLTRSKSVTPATRAFEASWQSLNITNVGVSYSSFSFDGQQIRGLLSGRGEGVLMQVPKAAALLADAESAKSPIPHLGDFAWRSLKASQRASLLLLLEWERGAASPLAEYVEMLVEVGRTKSLFTPLHWDASLQASLRDLYPPLGTALEEQQRENKRLYEVASAAFPLVPFSQYVWATDMVRSRSFKFQGLDARPGTDLSIWAAFAASGLSIAGAFYFVLRVGKATKGGWLSGLDIVAVLLAVAASAPLVLLLPRLSKAGTTTSCVLLPGIDSANHHSRLFNANLEFEPSLSAFILVSASTDKNKNDENQVLLNYGPLSNDELLLRFGFVEADNPYDNFVVEAGTAGVPQPVTILRSGPDSFSVDGATDFEESLGLRGVLEAQLERLERGASAANASRLLSTFIAEKKRVLRLFLRSNILPSVVRG